VILDWARRANLAAQVDVTTDAAILLAAGTPDNWGIAVVAGTGSIAYGRSPDGRTARAGGWGYLLGDEGSGYALVIAALRAVLCGADGRGPETRLGPSLLDRLGLSQVDGVIPAIYRGNLDRAALASHAPLVLELAEAGDTVASGIVENAVGELAELTAAVGRQLEFGQPLVPIALSGGVFLGSKYYRQKFLAASEQSSIRGDPVTPVSEPAEGAIRTAAATLRLVQLK
jgi:N-acetylglucosamine kinase-like BadF-type ATPase